MASAPSENRDIVLVGPVKRGRPGRYSDEIAEAICERIANGETLDAICEDDDMPAQRTVIGWLMRDEGGFVAPYARAREHQADREADQIRNIADDLRILPEHKRIMVDARKWRAERLNRRVYGNVTKHEIETPQHAPGGAEQLPAGLAWLAGHLENKSDKES